MKLVRECSFQDFNNHNVEEKLWTLNCVWNLYTMILEQQATSSVYSRLKCMDAYLHDLVEAIKTKTQTAREIKEAQPTEYREQELSKLEKLTESLPVLEKFVGEWQKVTFKNCSLKLKNIKLALGESIYKEILLKTFKGEFHSFSLDGVEDIKIHHSINLFFQSKTATIILLASSM